MADGRKLVGWHPSLFPEGTAKQTFRTLRFPKAPSFPLSDASPRKFRFVAPSPCLSFRPASQRAFSRPDVPSLPPPLMRLSRRSVLKPFASRTERRGWVNPHATSEAESRDSLAACPRELPPTSHRHLVSVRGCPLNRTKAGSRAFLLSTQTAFGKGALSPLACERTKAV